MNSATMDTEIDAYTEKIGMIINDPKFADARAHKNVDLEKIAEIEGKIALTADGDEKLKLSHERLDVSQSYDVSIRVFNEMQNNLSHLVREREELRTEKDKVDGVHKEYVGDTLGKAIKVASLPTGSEEWLVQRKNGVGGSDVGSILGFVRGRNTYRELMADKLSDVTEEDLLGQNVEGSAAMRGNNWEEAIFRTFASRHPEYDVIHSKESWMSKNDDFQVANVDGLIAHKGSKNIKGILEIKTSNRPLDWTDGVPLKYLSQSLWYLDTFGLDFFHVAVVIDSVVYRDYYFTRDLTLPVIKNGETVMMGIAQIREEVREFWRVKIENEEKMVVTDKTAMEVLTSNSPYPRGLPKSVTPSRVKMLNALRQTDYTPGTAKEMRDLMTSIDVSAWSKNIVSIDLETTRFSPRTGYIIEFGGIEYDKDGNSVNTFDEMFDIPDQVKGYHGTGAEDIHHISPEDIDGKDTFEQASERVLKFLEGKVLLAHNAQFELGWLNLHLPGFADLNLQVIDTMRVATHLLPESKDSRLETICGDLKVDYSNGHRAYHDAKVAGEAFFAMLDLVKK